MSQRQVLCIDDPMEMGRSLGASFQGFERLCFEWRRAFHLLTPRSEVSDAEDLQNLRELFHEKAIYQLEKHRVFPTLVDGAAREREPRERSNKIPWAERPERPERRERLAEREQGAPNWSGRSWYNGAAFQGQGTQGPQGPQGPWRGSSKGNNVGPKGKGTLGSGPHGPPAGAGYEPREMREGKGYRGFAWPRPGRAQEMGTGAKGKAKNSKDSDRNSLAAALRSRGGATQATRPSSRKRPTRGRSRHSEVEQSSATSSASATSSTSATSTEKRPTSWAPNATILAEQFGDLLHRGIEAAGQWRASQEVARSASRSGHMDPRWHLGGAQQRLQSRLQEWFAKQHEFQGAPPRLTSRLFPVQRGQIMYTQVLLVWRGIEIQLLLGPSERDPEFAIFGARTECHGLADVGDSILRALEECLEDKVEVFMESLMPVDDEDISEEGSVQAGHEDALVQFICNRPPMHRLQKAPNGIAFAWDFPLSRQERMEFFLVNTLAQEQSEADHQELQEEASVRRRRWSRASGVSRASGRSKCSDS
eukprot:s2925_g4.t1